MSETTETEAIPEGPTAGATAPHSPRRSGPRGSTLTWGILLLLISAATLVGALVDPAQLTPSIVLWTIVAIGSALVIVALVVATVRAVTTRAD